MIQAQLQLFATSANQPTRARIMVWDVVNPDVSEPGKRTTYTTWKAAWAAKRWNEVVSPRWMDAPPDPPTA